MTSARPARVLVALLAAWLVAACGSGDDDTTEGTGRIVPATSTTAEQPTTAPGDEAPWPPSLALEPVAPVEGALAMTVCAGRDGFLVASKTGPVVAVPGGQTVVDLTGEVSTGNEQGLLGIACSADGTLLYLSYTNRPGDTRLDVLELATGRRRTVFAADQPVPNHNGGHVVFGPDGRLWLGLGDGGGAGDPFDNAQDPSTLLGSLVRFDDPAAGSPAEVVVIGLRNPWRFSFDEATGDLWIGDVGQARLEEIDHLAAGRIDGANLGWPALEGTRPFEGDPPPNAVPPVYEYGLDGPQAVVGGHVYRGEALPGLVGTYLFADTYEARLRALRLEGGRVVEHRDLDLPVPGGLVASFGVDAAGELYVLSLASGVHRVVAG